MAALEIVQPVDVCGLDIMGMSVHAIYDQMQPVAHLIACKSPGQNSSDNRLSNAFAVCDVIAGTTLIGKAVIVQRSVHGFDDIAPLAKGMQCLFRIIPDRPSSGSDLIRQAIALQALRPVDQKQSVGSDGVAVGSIWAKADDPLFLALRDQDPVEPGQAFGLDLMAQFFRDLQLALLAQFQRHQCLGPVR